MLASLEVFCASYFVIAVCFGSASATCEQALRSLKRLTMALVLAIALTQMVAPVPLW